MYVEQEHMTNKDSSEIEINNQKLTYGYFAMGMCYAELAFLICLLVSVFRLIYAFVNDYSLDIGVIHAKNAVFWACLTLISEAMLHKMRKDYDEFCVSSTKK